MGRRPSTALAAALPPAVLVALGWVLLRQQGFFLVDDAYISFRYAANLAAGHGLVWNPGEAVEGYTNLFWVLLLTPWAAAGVDLVWPAAAMGSLAGCGCLELLRRTARRLWPTRSPLLCAAPGLVLASMPSFAYWSTGGLEAPLFALWTTLGIHQVVFRSASPGGSLTLGAVLAAGCLTRPEGVLVGAVILAAGFGLSGGSVADRLRRILPAAALVAAVVAVHLVFRLAYYGDPLPNTFYAKVIIGTVSLKRGLVHLWGFLLAGGLLCLPGLYALRRATGAERRVLGHGYALLVVYLAYLILIGGDHPGWYRFYLPLLPVPLLALVSLLLGPRRRRQAARHRERIRAVVAGLAVTGALVVAWPLAEPSTTGDTGAAGLVNSLVQEAFFARQVPRDAFVAASAVGRVGYDNPGWHILDAWGLNDRHIARQQRAAKSGGKFGHDKTDWLYVLSRAPDHVITFSARKRLPRLRGYDPCWPSWFFRPLLIYRRNWALAAQQRFLGMPREGPSRAPGPPPACDRPR